MIVKQVSVFLENSPGHLKKVCQILADARINLQAVTIAETQNFGVLRIIADDTVHALEALKAGGVAAREVELLALPVQDKAGALLDILDKIKASGLNLEYMYSLAHGADNRPVMLMKFTDLEAAHKILMS